MSHFIMEAVNDITSISNKMELAYKISKEIGNGAYGDVFEAEHTILNIQVAMKRPRKDHANTFCKELVSLQKLNHPNIIQLYHVFSVGIHYFLVMEMAPGCDLYTYLAKDDIKLDENICRIVGRQLASALCYMHEQQIVHRDLKLENIMYDESTMKVKIIDFGLSGFLGGKNFLMKFCGTEGYIAPEIHRQQPYDGRVDMWSLGIMFYEMLTGILPDITPTCNDIEEVVKIHLQLTDITNTSTHLQSMLASLLQPEPSKRLNSFRLCQHPWITASFKQPVVTYGYEPLPTSRRFQIYKKLALLTNNTIGDTVNLVETNASGHFSGMYRMLSGPELDKLYIQKCTEKSEEKKVLDDCNNYSKRRLRLNSVQAEMLH